MKVFFDYEILEVGKTVIMSILFSNFMKIFLRTHHSYYLSKKSDCQFCEWSSVMFQKMTASVREKKN